MLPAVTGQFDLIIGSDVLYDLARTVTPCPFDRLKLFQRTKRFVDGVQSRLLSYRIRGIEEDKPLLACDGE